VYWELCTFAIMAEAIMNRKGLRIFTAYSAGSHPKGAFHPAQFGQVEMAGLPVSNCGGKPWDEFAQPGAPQLDFVFTVCDNREQASMSDMARTTDSRAHGECPDPAAVEAHFEQIAKAFRDAFMALDRRIGLLLVLRTLKPR